ncbi:MAG: MATE family efflux transporter [Steroidobacteraceae bacterium]|nr:MATE family efflux transporter [Steroidobacteraceae bacterium]
MKDLSTGSIPRHISSMAFQMAIGILVQTLYFFVDLYFVSKLGDASIAGVGAAGNVWFVVLALTQILSVGTVALVSQAVGAQQRDVANNVFNQALLMSGFICVVVIVGVYAAAGPYMRAIGADQATAQAGIDYLYWYAPGLGLQFLIIAMFSTLRATGIVKPTMYLQMFSVIVNIVLAPVLIAGWGTGKPMGVAGAGLATTLAIVLTVIWSAYYFHRHEKYVTVHREQLRFQAAVWKRLFLIGLPVGLEFVLIAIVMAVIYLVIRDFGAAAQAGFGIGQRVMQMVMLPAMAVAFSLAPIAGQNFGARKLERVRETFTWGVGISVAIMSILGVLVWFEARGFMQVFTTEEAVVLVGAEMLMISAFNFPANGVIFSCSSMFQALGNTWPTIGSSIVRLVVFIGPALWLSTRPGFELHHLWYLSVASMFLQAVVSFTLLRREFAKKLGILPIS